jgi:hypothetical protein
MTGKLEEALSRAKTQDEADRISFLEAVGVLDGARSVEVFPDALSWVILPLGEAVGGPTQQRVAFGEEAKLGLLLTAMFSTGEWDLTPRPLPPPALPAGSSFEFDGTPCLACQWVEPEGAGVRICRRCSAEEALPGAAPEEASHAADA